MVQSCAGSRLYSQIARLVVIIAISSRREKKNIGIVIFVGNAARLVISAIAIAAMAKAHATMLFPVSIITDTVNGVIKHACPAKATPNQRKRLSSWFLHHAINRVHIDGLLSVLV